MNGKIRGMENQRWRKRIDERKEGRKRGGGKDK